MNLAHKHMVFIVNYKANALLYLPPLLWDRGASRRPETVERRTEQRAHLTFNIVLKGTTHTKELGCTEIAQQVKAIATQASKWKLDLQNRNSVRSWDVRRELSPHSHPLSSTLELWHVDIYQHPQTHHHSSPLNTTTHVTNNIFKLKANI